MRALFVGRLEALAGLAAACEEAGHDVAFAGPPRTAAAIELAGFEALPAGLEVDAEFAHQVAALAGDLGPLADDRGVEVIVHDDDVLVASCISEVVKWRNLSTVAVWTQPVPPASEYRIRADVHLATLPPSLQMAAQPEHWVTGEFGWLRPGPFRARPPDEDVAVGPADWAFVLGALAAGTPVVMAPRDGEADLAFRVRAAGAGVLDGPDAVHHLLDEPLYFANAQRLRREIAAMPSPAEVVTALVRMAAAR